MFETTGPTLSKQSEVSLLSTLESKAKVIKYALPLNISFITQKFWLVL